MVQLLRLLDVRPLDIWPQHTPFNLIDGLTHYDETATSTRFLVRPDHLFVSDGCLLPTGLIENMAQTCAARLGYYNLISGLPVKIGFIGAVNNLHIRRTPWVGESLDTTIRVKEEVFGMTLVDAEVRVDAEVIATAEMKIAIP